MHPKSARTGFHARTSGTGRTNGTGLAIRTEACLLAGSVLAVLAQPAFADLFIPTVRVGYEGNAGSPQSGSGAVAYAYHIGTTEVTNAQYASFLNAVARSDPNGLYNESMASGFGGITRSGVAGSYTYAVREGKGNHPVNFVSFWDATRFANWMNNGQPTGAQGQTTTEDGAYTLTASGMAANTVGRNDHWRWAVTSGAEWHKAAYFQPATAGGDPSNFWTFPNASHSITLADANYDNPTGGPVAVGTYAHAKGFFGTFDMGGNVAELTEQIVQGSFRGRRGGSYDLNMFHMHASILYSALPTAETGSIGFRVVNIPGAPTAAMLAAAAGFGACGRRRRAV